MWDDGTLIWDPNFVTPDWAWGSSKIGHWELVIPTHYGGASSGRRYTGVLVHPNGVLTIDGKKIQCASAEEAKELGITTYLLTKEGG